MGGFKPPEPSPLNTPLLFLVRFYAYIFGVPFQSESTHRSKALFVQILRIIIFEGLFQSDSTFRSEAHFGQILRIINWRPFSVRFNGYIRGPFRSNSTHKYLEALFSQIQRIYIRGPFWSNFTHKYLEALFSHIQRIVQRPFLVRFYT